MWRFTQFVGQVLSWEVTPFMKVVFPVRTIRHILDEALISHLYASAAFTGIAAQFGIRNDAVGWFHWCDYNLCAADYAKHGTKPVIRILTFVVDIP